MTCPTPDDLVRLTAGTLAAVEQRAVEVHLDVCEVCRETVSTLIRDQSERPRFGRYRLDGELGQGGMGIVFRAWDPQLARAVAIKVVRHGDSQHRARLAREAQSLARLSHPHVCQVYDVGQHGDEVWFAMELIDGVTLRAWVVDRSAEEILGVLLAVAEGLAAAHVADLVHRDVKPDNVLVDRRGRAVVTDFGLARILATDAGAPSLTSTGAVFGSPGYMAPEQLSGSTVDARADQFSWAVSAWELLAPSRPLPGDPTARIVAIVSGLTPPPELSPAIGAVLVRALAIDPEDRFASMDDLLIALRGPSPAVARPLRRHLLIAAATIAVIGTVGITLTTRTRDVTPIATTPTSEPPPADATLHDAAPATRDASPDDPLPAGYRRLPPLAGTDVDVEAEWSHARDDAVHEFPDARVHKLDATGVTAAGTVDVQHGGTVTTNFFSPSAYRKGETQTEFSTSRGATGGYATLMPSSGGDPRAIPWPRCTVHQIWQRAAAARSLPAGGTASITYVKNPFGRPTWYFVMGPIDLRFPDGC